MDPLLTRFGGRDAAIDCDGCTACCRKECVILTEQDDAGLYETIDVIHPLTDEPAKAIPHADDGACIYLGEAGCTIYDRRPAICRAFSCVGWVAGVLAVTTRAERRRDMRDGYIDREVWDAGMKRRVAPASVGRAVGV